MIDRYIYGVIKDLPKNQREEISKEIRVLIEDILEGMDDSIPQEEQIDRALRELGDPKEFANRYRGKERYLIGPKYFDRYVFVLKIVALSVFIGISIASGLGTIFSIDSLVEAISNYMATVFSAVLYGAAWVTGIFALLEYYEVSLDDKDKLWEPAQLPLLPEKKAVISKSESIFSIILITIMLSIFFFVPEKIGIYYDVGDGWGFIRLFDMGIYSAYKLVIFIVFTLNISIELFKIIKGRWTLKTAMITTALNFSSAALSIYFIYSPIWEKGMIKEIEKYAPLSFERILLVVSAIILMVTLMESLWALYKGAKYGKEDGNSIKK
ncbi:MAG: hypothetical protein GX046_01970 [Tissierellia bacterium]|jgi:hypothetical protein|nr:hypothetical protein [Tissierellia bacterium]